MLKVCTSVLLKMSISCSFHSSVLFIFPLRYFLYRYSILDFLIHSFLPYIMIDLNYLFLIFTQLLFPLVIIFNIYAVHIISDSKYHCIPYTIYYYLILDLNQLLYTLTILSLPVPLIMSIFFYLLSI
jgi:hypothetical protein